MITVLSNAHVDICSNLHAACFDKKWSSSEFKDLLGNPSISIFGYFQKSQLIGLIVVSFIIDQAEIYTICTHPDYQRQGIASKIMEYIKKECTDRLMTAIFLEVAVSNNMAIKFYEKHAFKSTSIRRGYYRINNQAVDAIMMQYDCD